MPAPGRPEVSRAEEWAELRSVFPIYLALAKQLEIAIPFPQDKRNLPEKPPLELFKQIQNWLDGLDSRVLVHQLRHLLQQTTLNASESGLRALIQRHLRKPSKTNIDRDKIDFLLVQYFALCAPAKIYHKQIGLEQLDTAGVHIIDCKRFGLSSSEPISKIRQLADEWKQPFQKEYTERTVNETFEKLLNLRAAVEQALERLAAKQAGPIAPTPSAPAPRASQPAKAPAKPSPASKSEPAVDLDGSLDFEACLEQIWEQLIATPPTRGRSMTTVKIGRARILMSSWEVTAFVSEDGPAADDLRRAVVARAMVTSATEAAKETGNATGLDRALSVARVEVSRLQERVDVAKQAKDTEAAVNLGISTKRLLSALDEAEKL